MEGIFFYWTAWMFLVIVYFLFDYSSIRSWSLIGGLFTIILSSTSITLATFEWNLAFLSLFVFCIYLMVHLNMRQLTFGYFISLLIASWFYFVYHAFYIEPVWLIVSPLWMITSLNIILVIAFLRDWPNRIYVLLIGNMQGIILAKVNVYYLNGNNVNSLSSFGLNSMLGLDIIALTSFIVGIWTILEVIGAKLEKKLVVINKTKINTKANMNA